MRVTLVLDVVDSDISSTLCINIFNNGSRRRRDQKILSCVSGHVKREPNLDVAEILTAVHGIL